jgi:maltooligosyltrehalose trehalohydrolase
VAHAASNAVAQEHEDDQYLQAFPPQEFNLTHSVIDPYGDSWSTTVPIAETPAPVGSAWGRCGRYVYRYVIENSNVGRLDWIIDPFAREFGVGKLSAFTLGYTPHAWSAAKASWKTPPLQDLALYEVNVAELGGILSAQGA